MKNINLLPKEIYSEKQKWVIIGITFMLISLMVFYGLWHGSQYRQSPATTPIIAQLNQSQKSLFTSHPIHRLKMIGFLKRSENKGKAISWGLIQSPGKEIIPVKLGDYLGQESAKVIAITPTQIHLTSEETEQLSFIKLENNT